MLYTHEDFIGSRICDFVNTPHKRQQPDETIDGIPNTFSQSISTFDLFFSFFFSLNSREVNTLASFCRDDAGK